MQLSALLSQALVAFTIEFDNEFEYRAPHRTTRHGASGGSSGGSGREAKQGPWLVSMAMWMNCLQFIGDEGIDVRKLAELARTPTNLKGMIRWGYISIGADKVVRATPRGRMAQRLLRPLCGDIERRWRTRFGNDRIDELREALAAILGPIDRDLPDCMPILGYGLLGTGPTPGRLLHAEPADLIRLALPTLMSRVLLTFALDYERESDWSLAVGANVLRVLDAQGVRVRDIPRLSGVSKEAIAMALGVMQKGDVAVVTSEKTVRVARLTAKGVEAQGRHFRLLEEIEQRWEARYSESAVRRLREALQLPLLRGLEPYPDGWRASVGRPVTLPHYPMVLHRGGFPDGS